MGIRRRAFDSPLEKAVLDKQFHVQNAAARRQLTTPINGPALTWHHAFWKPETVDNSGLRLDKAEAGWRYEIDSALLEIYHVLASTFAGVESENVENGKVFLFCNWSNSDERKLEPIGGGVRNVVKFLVPFETARLIIVAEMFKEFWTMTYILEVFVPEYYRERPKRNDTPEPIARVQRLVTQTLETLNGNSAQAVPESGYQTWRDGVDGPLAAMSEFREFVDSYVNLPVIHRLFLDRSKPLPWGGKFLDFKGLLVPIEHAEASPQPQDLATPPPQATDWEFTTKWRRRNQSVTKTVAPSARPTRQGWLGILGKLWPAVDSLREGAAPVEVTASTFQSRRSLYVSSLGREYPSEALPKTHSIARRARSVKFLVAVSHRSKWQLGRLIDRLHKAGTMRVAAMRDIAGIEKTNEELDLLRAAIRIDSSRMMEGEQGRRRGKSLREILAERHSKLKEIQNIESITGGLEFRLFRSKFYIEEFRNHASALRVGRIAGFQPYDEFVERRLSSAFGAIQLTLDRFKEARSELDTLFQRVQAELMIDLTRTAEVFGGLGSVYYAGSVLLKVMHGAGGNAWLTDEAAVYLVLLLGFLLFLSRRRRSHRWIEAPKKKSSGQSPAG